MPGKQCVNNNVRESRSYCEGRIAASVGLLIGADPHPADSPASVAWLAGFASWEDDPANGNAGGADCCAEAYGGGYVAP